MSKKKIFNIDNLIFVTCILFYISWFFADGVTFSNDSWGYIHAIPSRESLYPTYLFLFRRIFSKNIYLKAASLVQCILAAIATFKFSITVERKWSLKKIPTLIIVAMQLGVVLLCRFVANRQAAYCNEICSEGLAIPLFVLFITEILMYAWEKNTGALILSSFYAVCLICVRKQMYIVIPIMILVFIIQFFRKDIGCKRLLGNFGIVLLVFLVSVGADIFYNYCVRGVATRHTTDSSAAVITLVYASGTEDAGYFENKEIRTLYTDIMQEVEKNGYNYKYASGNWVNRYNHYSDHYDLISYGILNKAFYDYIERTSGVSGLQKEQAFDDLNHMFIDTLLPANWKRAVVVITDNIMAGICNTISKADNRLTWYNVLFVLIYLGLLVYMGVQKKEKAFWLGTVILISTAMNVAAVGVMIFAQNRYMIYNMPFVYIAMYLMLREVYFIWKDKAKRRAHA